MILKFILFAAGALTLIGGVGIFNVSTTAIHEIEAFLLLIISAVCFSGVTVAEAVDRLRKDVLAAGPAKLPAKREDAA
jgi:hypothetical protein